MKKVGRFLLCAAACVLFQISTAPGAFAAPIAWTGIGDNLASFAVLGGTGVTNASGTGNPTIVNGNLGVSPADVTIFCTGFPAPCTGDGPGIVNGAINPGNEAAAMLDLNNILIQLGAGGYNLTGTIGAGGLDTFSGGPGVYSVVSTESIDLVTALTLNGTGTWVFQMSTSLITGAGATVDITGVGAGSSVVWLVPTAVTLNAGTTFAGEMLAGTKIEFLPGATDVCGAAFSQTTVSFAGQLTTEPNTANQVGGEGCNVNGGGGNGGNHDVPEPGTLVLLGTGLAGLVARSRRSARA